MKTTPPNPEEDLDESAKLWSELLKRTVSPEEAADLDRTFSGAKEGQPESAERASKPTHTQT